MQSYDDRYLAALGKCPKRIPHYEHWSCPDAESYLTGIDYYLHPRLCRLKLKELYPELNLPIPQTDESISRPVEDNGDERDKNTVRWGDGRSWGWEHGESYFKSPEQVFAFSPLENPDFRNMSGVVMNYDFSSEEIIYKHLFSLLPQERQQPIEGAFTCAGFYNTMFMWPLLTFGWDLFLQCCMDKRFERIMDEFAMINRRVFAALSRLPVNFIICHDDITITRGPICSPEWMKKYIFPRYEEFWSILKSKGKHVVFMSDGCLDIYVDDVIACGACGIMTEPYTDFKAIARRHPEIMIAGQGDNRILMENNPQSIRKMVKSMFETARITKGYMMCIGNHIPWNIPPDAIKIYLQASRELNDMFKK